MGYTVGMRRDDFILRLIAQLIHSLHIALGLARSGEHEAALETLDRAVRQLTGLDIAALTQLSPGEVVLRVSFAETDEYATQKCLVLAALLNQAGEIYSADLQIERADACWLHALRLVLYAERQPQVGDWPVETPHVERLVARLGEAILPLDANIELLGHYERVGAYAKAEDTLFRLIDAADQPEPFIAQGIALYQRLQQLSDDALLAGDLSRAEVDAALAELRARAAD